MDSALVRDWYNIHRPNIHFEFLATLELNPRVKHKEMSAYIFNPALYPENDSPLPCLFKEILSLA